MFYFLVSEYKNCLKLLLKYDCVGCNYTDNPFKHFIGNFWWANTNYINKLSKIYDSSSCISDMWLLQENVDSKPYSLYNSSNIETEIPNKIRVKMLCNWCSPIQLCNEWSNMCEIPSEFMWKNIEMTWTDIDIDYYVIINFPPYGEYFDPKRTIVFQMEPWVKNPAHPWGTKTWGKWANPDPEQYLEVRGRKTGHCNNAMWQLETSLPEFLTMNIDKTELISSICSSKYNDEGHIARINLLKYIESKGDIIIDVYGRDNIHEFNNYKGQISKKTEGIMQYKYYFMFENNYEENYITEKLWEPILCESLVFYYGCPNVTEYINPEAFVLLDPNDFEKSYQIIKKAIEEDWWSQRLDVIRREKYKILKELSFFPVISKIFNPKTNLDCELTMEKFLRENNIDGFINEAKKYKNIYKLINEIEIK